MGLLVEWGGVPGDLQGESNSISQVDESQIWHQLAGSVALSGVALRKGTMAFARLSAWQNSVPQLLP